MSAQMMLELKWEPDFIYTNVVRAKAGACIYLHE